MSLSDAMLRTAALAASALGGHALQVRRFVERQRCPGGGYCNRAGQPDLYYTVFGMDCLTALTGEPPDAGHGDFVRAFGNGESLDVVHLACLARCWARLPGLHIDRQRKAAWRRLLEAYRTPDGGYGTDRGASTLSASASFLAAQALDDLGLRASAAPAALKGMASLRAGDGAYGNVPGLEHGTTLATAAVIVLWRRLRLPVPPALVAWVEARCHGDGGFLASPAAPLPDLLSTATALYALRCLRRPLGGSRRAACLRFVELCMTEAGGFCGHLMEATPDCEYTFHALLALGCMEEGSWRE